MNPEDLRTVLLNLATEDLRPTILDTYRAFLQLAGLEDDDLPIIYKSLRSMNRVAAGDVFFKEEDLYYVVSIIDKKVGPGESWLESAVLYERLGRTSSDILERNSQPGIEIGIISPISENVDERLKTFATSLEKASGALWINRNADHLGFDWQPVKTGTPNLSKIISMQGEQSGPKFDRAEFTLEESSAAEILTSKLVRETLIDISQTGFARERDILGKKGKAQDDVRESLSELKNSGLLNIEYLLECKQDGTPLTRLKDPRQIEDKAIKNLLCPLCNSNFSQGSLTERYSLSELGHKMIRKSHWMTVWVTVHLQKLGIPEEAVLWNISEAGEEVDLLVEFLEQLWIFELKDKEFGSGNAHAFSFRQVRYHANKAFIITTDKVSRDAKNVFEELARERQPSSSSNNPICIEGLNLVESNLHNEISKTRNRYARRRLALIRDLSGYDIYAIYSIRFERKSKSSWTKDNTDIVNDISEALLF